MDPTLTNVIRARMANGLSWFQKRFEINKDDVMLIEPENEVCTQCGHTSLEESLIRTKGTIFTTHGIQSGVNVSRKQCVGCRALYYYDGRDDGILNYRNLYFFPIEFFYEALELKTHSGMPTSTWWKGKIDMALLTYDGIPHIELIREKWKRLRSKVSYAITEFLMLVDLPPKLFQCCSEPDVVCVDGIVLSIESARIKQKNLMTPWKESTPSSARASTRKDRNYWYLKKSKKYNPVDKVGLFSSVKSGISMGDISAIIRACPGPLADLMKLVAVKITNYGSTLYQCPPMLRPIYRSACKPISPALALIPSSLWIDVDRFLDNPGPSCELIGSAAHFSPALSQFLAFIMLHEDNTEIFKCGLLFVRDCFEKAKSSVQKSDPTINNVKPREDLNSMPDHNAREEFEKTGVFFPGRPYQNTVTDCHLSRIEEKREGLCNKDYKETGKFGAGMVLFWCAKHRECIGWIMLQSAESVEIVYSTLITRFKKLPKVIIYDNGCNLYEYCHNRAPDIFRDTVILSDGFHFMNHTNCSISFDSCIYPFLKGISSVTHEQKNANLAKFKKISIFMRFDAFTECMHYVLHNMNYRERNYNINKYDN